MKWDEGWNRYEYTGRSILFFLVNFSLLKCFSPAVSQLRQRNIYKKYRQRNIYKKKEKRSVQVFQRVCNFGNKSFNNFLINELKSLWARLEQERKSDEQQHSKNCVIKRQLSNVVIDHILAKRGWLISRWWGNWTREIAPVSERRDQKKRVTACNTNQ